MSISDMLGKANEPFLKPVPSQAKEETPQSRPHKAAEENEDCGGIA